MVDIKLILKDPESFKLKVIEKGYDPACIDKLVEVYRKFVELKKTVEEKQKERNVVGRKSESESFQVGKRIKEELKVLESELVEVEKNVAQLLWQVPNPAFDTVPKGKSEAEYVEIKKNGDQRRFNFVPKDHFEIGKNLGIIDFESGSKTSGSQFFFLKGKLVLLEFALISYGLKLLSFRGFMPIITPDLAKSRYYLGTGYAPHGNEAQTYSIEGEDLGLIATAEVTLAGIHADNVIPELPLLYAGYSHAFRKEAGAYGKYSKGLYRVHQFSKLEMFVYCIPEKSSEFHALLLEIEEQIYTELGLPYRVLEMCTGDLGGMAAKKFDIEAWMPGRGDYGEVTSTSNCTDYQARNLNIRYRKDDGKLGYVHMLNGTAIATSRTIIAILENYQNEDGSVSIPEVLIPYLNFEKIKVTNS